MNTLKQLRQSKPLRVFVRQTFNGFVTLLLGYLAELQGDQIALLPIIYATINAITKYVNKTWFGDLGVQ